MRKRLPETAKLFLVQMSNDPSAIGEQVRQAAQGHLGLPNDSVNGVERWLFEPSGRIWFVTEVGKRSGLHATEIREAFLHLSKDAQLALDAAVDGVLQAIRDSRRTQAFNRVVEEHGE